MITRKPVETEEIDMTQEVPEPIEGERGPADMGRKRGGSPGAKAFLMSSIGAVVLVGGFVTYKSIANIGQDRVEAEQKEKANLVTNRLPPIQPSREATGVTPVPPPGTELAEGTVDPNQVPPLTAAPITPTETGGVATAGGAGGGQRPPSPAELLRARRLGGGFGSGLGDGSGAGAGGGDDRPAVAVAGTAGAGGDAGGAGGNDTVQSRLQPVKLASSRAGRLGDRNLLITKGSMIDCGLGTRLDSTVPGMVSCYVTRDVWSANGAVVLIPRNSKITGSYGKGIAHGQSRLFVTWDRVESPNGVVIDLDSPGTDQLGGSGIPGKVDSHFGARYGGAILMSVLSDALQAGIAAASRGSTNINTTGQTSDELANTALQASINIPPTLYKNQGDRVNIFVARDLDFSGIYALKRR